MKLGRLLFLPAMLPALMLAAPAREIVELQRDVAALQEQVRQLQRTLDERLASLSTLMQQSVDSANKSNTSLAVLETGIRDRMAEQQKSLVGPIASMGAKLDQMTTEFAGVRDSVGDLTERMNKLQTQLLDLSNTVKTLQSMPAPPGASTTGSAPPPPGLSAKSLYDTAMRDQTGGNLDLALQGYQEYLKFFGDTELAPNAQFYIGQILYNKNEFPRAIEAFDMVLERYPENSKTADAMYMKGMSLLKSGQRTQAGQEFQTLIEKFPNAEVTGKAKQQRRALGLGSSSPAAGARKSTPRR